MSAQIEGLAADTRHWKVATIVPFKRGYGLSIPEKTLQLFGNPDFLECAIEVRREDGVIILHPQQRPLKWAISQDI